MVIFALGMTAPVASVTVPSSVPFMACPKERPTGRSNAIAAINRTLVPVANLIARLQRGLVEQNADFIPTARERNGLCRFCQEVLLAGTMCLLSEEDSDEPTGA